MMSLAAVMLAPFLIMLREGLEAALIVSIIASYLRQTGERAALPAIWVGVFLAVALSLLVGAALLFAKAEFPQKAQEGFEAAIGVLAIAMLTTMVFWMRSAGCTMGTELRQSIDAALASRRPGGRTFALVGAAFFAVAREGLESIFFLLAVVQQGQGSAATLGAVAGVAVAVAAGYAFYLWGIRIDLRRFFRWTGVFILIVAAGLLAGALRHLHEAGIWNHLQTRVFNLADVLPVSGLPGTILSGIFNYQEAPTRGEALAYVGFLVVTLGLFLQPASGSPRGAPASATQR